MPERADRPRLADLRARMDQLLLAADAGFDGQVCGHIHYGHIRRFGDFTYMNDGDWVEHCTALIEHHDGRFELLPWRRSAEGNEPSRRSPRRPAVIGQQA